MWVAEGYAPLTWAIEYPSAGSTCWLYRGDGEGSAKDQA
jgi:hypothetical protein